MLKNDIEIFKKSILKELKNKNAIAEVPQGEILQRIPCGIFVLDALLGGGIPLGKVMEIYGKPSSAKTTLALQLLKPFCKLGIVHIFDTESSIDSLRLQALGYTDADLNSVIFWRSLFLEDVFNNIKEILKQDFNKPQIILVDTVSQCACSNEVESEDPFSMGIGYRARTINKWCRVVSQLLGNNITIIFNNHIIQNIGKYMASEDSPGGKGIKHLSNLRIKLYPIKKNTDDTGILKGKIIKSKINKPNQEFELFFSYAEGVLAEESCIKSLPNIFLKSSSWIKLLDFDKEGNEIVLNKFQFNKAKNLSKDEKLWNYIQNKAFEYLAPDNLKVLKKEIPKKCLDKKCDTCKTKKDCFNRSLKRKLGLDYELK